MTREEAIQILIESKDETIERTMQEWDEYDKKLYQAIDMAIEALRTESSAEGKYEKAIKTLQEMPKYLNGIKAKQIKKISIDTIQGEWIEREDWNGDYYYDCSVCGESFVLCDGTPSMNLYHYCPMCGAKMDGERREP